MTERRAYAEQLRDNPIFRECFAVRREEVVSALETTFPSERERDLLMLTLQVLYDIRTYADRCIEDEILKENLP